MADLDRLTRLVVLRDDAQAALDAEVDRLIRAGVNYGIIANATGVSRQAVRQRHLRWESQTQQEGDTQ